MRKATKTLFVILVVSCLALSSLMASPNTWGWLFSSQPSEASVEQTENSEELNETSQKDSPSSEATFEVVEVEAVEEEDGWVMIKKSDLKKVVELYESAAGKTAKAKGYIAEAKETMEDSVAPYIIPAEPKTPKFQEFMTMDVQTNHNLDLQYGVSLGFIFKNCLMASVGVMKTGFNDWMNKDTYSVKASLGIVF